MEHFETVRVRKDGRKIDVSLTVSPVRDAAGAIIGASKIARDITVQKRGDAAQAFLAAVVASSDDAIIAKDLNGVIQQCNAATERVFGYSAAELIGRSVRVLIPADRQNEEDLILERIRRGERIEHFETQRVRKDGRVLDISLSISPIEDASVEWKTELLPVARLTLPIQDRTSARGKRIEEVIEQLAFDPWHARTDLRPLGNMMRARNHAYRASTRARKAAPEPTAMPSFD